MLAIPDPCKLIPDTCFSVHSPLLSVVKLPRNLTELHSSAELQANNTPGFH